MKTTLKTKLIVIALCILVSTLITNLSCTSRWGNIWQSNSLSEKKIAALYSMISWADKNNLSCESIPRNLIKLNNKTGVLIRSIPNDLSPIPESILQLTNLTRISIWQAQLPSLPKNIGNLKISVC